MDGLVDVANGASKIRSLVCKTPAIEKNPSNPLANGVTFSSRQLDHPEVSDAHNDVVSAIAEELRDVAWVTRWRFRLSTRTHATSDQFRDAGWRAGSPAGQPRTCPPSRRKFSDQSFRDCGVAGIVSLAMSERRDPFTDGHPKKLRRRTFRVHVKLRAADRRLLSHDGIFRETST
ncbi:hypothetical protein [Bradyrhizobium sp. S69]|uniref:hypothetical protein n=1 Tax=Bradyrhizobium sp. S69 TaxID=1641856 RepID=UPI00131DB3C1|nr:hypothetical protein [Bradyrhizobium sp. S69]